MLINRKDSALLIIDIQERLARVMKHRDTVIRNSKILINAAHFLKVPILATVQYPKGLGPLVDELATDLTSDPKVEKIHFNCCEEPHFMERLKELNRRQIIVIGMECHVCVLQTAVSLLDNGFKAHVVRDAVSSRTEENLQNGLSRMQFYGIEITNTESIVFELLGEAGTPEFKKLSALIK
ncbi:Hydrolase [Gammaproteobacteria bacterium]